MTKRNPYLQHTYESFDQPVPPRRHAEESPGIIGRLMDTRLARRFRSPLFATVALLAVGAAFAGIIIASYPDSEQPDENIPVVTADSSPLREAPADPGGMDVAHEDSTIYSSIRSTELQETPPIENLLAEEQPVDVQTSVAGAEAAPAPSEAAPSSIAALEPAPQAEKAMAEAAEAPPPSEMADAGQSIEDVKKAANVQVVETRSIPMKTEKMPLADASASQKPALAPAAGSPETLAYVRSVLDKKSGAQPAQVAVAEPSPEALASIEPTAGAATGAGSAIQPGNHFVQLASISSESAASKEWTKLQKTFPALRGAEYRVQRADLGAKGVFFRIQAGPMSKDSAKSVCESIKAQKPGGCLIVQ